MGILSLIRCIDNVLEELHQMQPTSLPDGDQHMYNTEKTFMRQFVLLGKENRVPPCLLPRDMTLWLLQSRNLPQEFREMQMRVGARMFKLLFVAWIKARILCLNKMQREVCRDLDEEERLSQLLGRKVTLEGLHKYISIVRPQAEQDTEIFLQLLFSELQISLSSVELTRVQRLTLCHKFYRATGSLVEKIVELSLDFLLEELEPPANEESITATLAQRCEGASKEIGRMLVDAMASIPCLCQYISQDNLLCICNAMAWRMSQSFFQNFVECSAYFHQLDLDDSLVIARDRVMSAIVQMVYMTNH
ncbi:uncharacterized protein LOC133479324 isoform X1 [Phyllopteryx taeniolatus]|uniref:uncharacterized protein LOC133479324 isoform X1 n=1 Tax=Phyllopteryx taeniolatus TaxID=161469 RepID=UPI002AD5A99F|nr:uncharacterized protein LOC133479324 isoform X1 [Phyllopteryx taeniolatus]